ncbi:probable G-protein coupled receptor 139 [Scyliorhinus torazame]|uniref:probable G-protein coupled receptor 139 n=1 Tax=Scyliorhinus torazame TaxID=75743 RepID=UPI003B5BEAEA
MYETYFSAAKIIYISIAIIGVPVNFVAGVILARGKCGLSACTTRYLVAMAASDLMVVITADILFNIGCYYFAVSYLNITPVCSVILVLTSAATDCSVWLTVAFTFDRFVAISCHNLKRRYCTGKTATVVVTTVCILLCFKNVPFYFVYEPGEIIDNVPWFCYRKPNYFTEPGWIIFDWFDTMLIPLFPFTLVLLFNALTVRYILVASKIRKGLRGQITGDKSNDPEMESRRKSMILLFTISGSFILLWLTFVIEFLYYSFTGKDPGTYTSSEFFLQQAGIMLANFNCCTNTFIYGLTQSKFRAQLKRAMQYPVASFIQLLKK